ncbi:hypothetical protein HPHPH45_0895 [Helicobacter pylori Hp H-45]|uniref:Uncharacterized protein n=1 Tax=Helicobacter pylori Hp H-45 TaxID=992050 RepID=J0C2D2_HELPX|nr:hypothetical protein HPHPH45_0895 [Helicobacter pylori Hp H-45]
MFLFGIMFFKTLFYGKAFKRIGGGFETMFSLSFDNAF